MSVLNRKEKGKMISFRLSPAEYEAAEKTCCRQGVRSVAMLARTATINSIDPEFLTASQQQSTLFRLQEQVRIMADELARLTSLVAEGQREETRDRVDDLAADRAASAS